MSDFTQAVDLAYHCTLFLVDPDVSREVAENAIDNAPKVRTGMSFAVRAAVLERFEPAERDPIPFVDYLPEPFAKVSNARVDEMLEHLNSFVAHEYEHGTDLVNGHVVRFADRTGVLDEGFAGAFAWLALQPESAVLTNDKDCHEAELKDGTVLFWEPSEKQWTVAAMDAVLAEFVSEHAAAVAP